jgi:ribosomal protein S18 acetylase RimI-like enzyme
MLQIKQATPADIPLIRDLTMKIWPQTYTSIIGKQQVAYMLGLFYSPETLQKQMAETTHKFILCYSDSEAVGFAAYSEMDPGIFKLHKLYIAPGAQRSGAGKFIISKIVDDVRSVGARSLRLNVNKYNYPAMAFYAKTGFKLFAEEDIDIGNGYFMNDYVLNMELL